MTIVSKHHKKRLSYPKQLAYYYASQTQKQYFKFTQIIYLNDGKPNLRTDIIDASSEQGNYFNDVVSLEKDNHKRVTTSNA